MHEYDVERKLVRKAHTREILNRNKENIERLSWVKIDKSTGSAKRWFPGLVNFVTALAYHSCLALPAAFTQPRDHLLAEPCKSK